MPSKPVVAFLLPLPLLSTSGCAAIRALQPEAVIGDTAAELAQAITTGRWEGVDVDDQARVDTEETLTGMDGIRPRVEVRSVTHQDGAGAAQLAYLWQLPDATWTYETNLPFRKTDAGWTAQWSPAVLHSRLTSDTRLVHSRVAAPRGRILNTSGETLAGPHPVMRLGLNRPFVPEDQVESSARRIATALDINADAFVARARSAGPQAFVEGLVVRGQSSDVIPSGFSDILGAAAFPDTRILPRERGFAEELIGQVGAATAEDIERNGGTVWAGQQIGRSGLQRRYEKELAGRPGTRVRLISRGGNDASEELLSTQPERGIDITLTLDSDLQSRAEEALEAHSSPAAIAILRPSSGEILALANSPGSDGAADANTGRYAPGSTFKIVTALALLRQGQTPDTVMTCNPTTTLDGRRFKNYSDFPTAEVGRTTLRGAIANSCNTALIDQHELITGERLRDAAGSLGLGVDHDLGFPAYFGAVPDPANTVGVGESIIGQAAIQASPLSMAAVAASVDSGTTVVPYLLPQHRSEVTARPLSPQEGAQLHELMQAVVTEGSARSLRGVADGAKTGTAEYGVETPLRTHAWMIAFDDDLAVAAFVKDGESGSQTAAPLIRAVLAE